MEIDSAKKAAVLRVLTAGFSGSAIRTSYDEVRLAWRFAIDGDSRDTLWLDLAEEWLDDHSEAAIEELLRGEGIVDRLRRERKVLVTHETLR